MKLQKIPEYITPQRMSDIDDVIGMLPARYQKLGNAIKSQTWNLAVGSQETIEAKRRKEKVQ